MLFGIIILAVAVLVAYLLNKSKVSEAKIEAPEKIEPVKEEQPVKKTVKKAKASSGVASKAKVQK